MKTLELHTRRLHQAVQQKSMGTKESKPFRGLANETGMLLAEGVAVVSYDDAKWPWHDAAELLSDPSNPSFSTGEVWFTFKNTPRVHSLLRIAAQAAPRELVLALKAGLSSADFGVVQDEADTDTDWYQALGAHYVQLAKKLDAANVSVGDPVKSSKTGLWGFKVKVSVPMSSLPKLPKDSPAQYAKKMMGRAAPPWL